MFSSVLGVKRYLVYISKGPNLVRVVVAATVHMYKAVYRMWADSHALDVGRNPGRRCKAQVWINGHLLYCTGKAWKKLVAAVNGATFLCPKKAVPRVRKGCCLACAVGYPMDNVFHVSRGGCCATRMINQ